MAATKVAYLAEGKLYLKLGDASPRLIESTFAQQVLDRSAKQQERDSWKSRDNPADPFARMIWGRRGAADPPGHVRLCNITAVSRGSQPDELLYALDTGRVGGLFLYNITADEEQRLFHKQEFAAKDLARHPHANAIALAIAGEDQTTHIGLMQLGGRGIRAVTEGDVRDESPAWIPPTADEPERKLLVYQSAGIARNAQGMFTGLGPYAICKLDLDNGKLSTLQHDASYDFLLPRVGVDGNLYFIRRPYRSEGQIHLTPLRMLKDALLFPFRFIRALFSFLNWFSMVFSGKPLHTAGGPDRELNTRYMMLWGKVIDAEKVMAAAAAGKAAPLVPATWQLMRQTPDGQQSVLAKSSLAFDLCADGQLVYTNGTEVFLLAADGSSTRLCAQKMVQHVLAVG